MTAHAHAPELARCVAVVERLGGVDRAEQLATDIELARAVAAADPRCGECGRSIYDVACECDEQPSEVMP